MKLLHDPAFIISTSYIIGCIIVLFVLFKLMLKKAKREIKYIKTYYGRFDNEIESLDWVKEVIEREDFDPALQLSEFSNVPDEHFHKLRKEYLDSRERLMVYLNIE